MENNHSSAIGQVIGGIVILLAAVGFFVYAWLVMTPSPAQSVQPTDYSTATIQKEFGSTGIIVKAASLNQAQASASSSAETYQSTDIGKTDLSKME